MDKLESIRVFIAVAQAGGFSAAARVLGQPLATVSRKVADLEASLGVRLFERSTRKVVLTESAIAYLEACRRIVDDLRDAEESVTGEYRAPKGELVVTAPVAFGKQHLQPVVVEFLRTYPEVDMRLMLVDRFVSLVEEHVDLAVRISVLADSGLVARRVGTIRMVVCAGPRYLQARGVPRHPSELINHSCIAWSGLGPTRSWLFREGGIETMVPIGVRLTTTMPESAVSAAVADLGLTQVTSYQAGEAVRAGALVPVLREFEAEPTPVSLVHAGRGRMPQKLRAFLEFAAPRLAERLRLVAEIF